MTVDRGHRRPRRRRAVLTVAFALLVGTACGCALSEGGGGDGRVASRVGADDGTVLPVDGPVVGRVHAAGFQTYTCQADPAAGALAWKFKAPEATFAGDGGLSGWHYAGPTWESMADGSTVVARKVDERPAPVAGAVPWLLLQATDHRGSGKLSDVTFIRRINTTGGKAPSTEGAKAGDERRVPYEADYVFYGPGATSRPAGR